MLSNKDFAKILSEGKGKGGGGGGSGKFDLDQIRQWDQEIRTKEHKKSAKKSSNQKSAVKEDNNATEKGDGYRDRAQERRNDANPDYDAQLEAAANMDAEQTKYLGGDEEHTHLVKGLDYALLRKVRSETEKKSAAHKEGDSDQRDDIISRLTEITPQSELGASLKALLVSDKASVVRAGGGSTAVSHTATHRGPKGKGSALARTAYEFDVDPLGDADLPTVLTRSKEVVVHPSMR